MSDYVWNNALHFALDWDENVCLGGGEPTMHPRFFQYLREALSYTETTPWGMLHGFSSVLVITNGRAKRKALRLVREYHERQELGEDDLVIYLSQDIYHEPVEWEVVEAFRNIKYGSPSYYQSPAIRDNPLGRVAKAGRGRNIAGAEDYCVCCDKIVKPNGDVKLCGCDNAPIIGNVIDGIDRDLLDVIDGDPCYNDNKDAIDRYLAMSRGAA